MWYILIAHFPKIDDRLFCGFGDLFSVLASAIRPNLKSPKLTEITSHSSEISRMQLVRKKNTTYYMMLLLLTDRV